MPQNNISGSVEKPDEYDSSEQFESVSETGGKRPSHRSVLRRVSCLSILFLTVLIGSMVLYLLPWRVICNLGVPFVVYRSRFGGRLLPVNLDRYQDLRYEEIFSSFPFYLVHDRRPKKIAPPFPDNYFSTSREPCSSPVYVTNEESDVLSGKTLQLVPWDTVEFEVPEGVTRIGPKAFWKCTRLKRVTLPSTLVSIGEGAFAGCESLKRIRIPDGVLMVGRHAFHGCTELSDVRMPANLAAIGRYAFYNCTSLKKVTLPHTLRWFGADAFTGCSELKTIRTSGPVPESFPAADKKLQKLLSEQQMNLQDTKFELFGSPTLKYASVPVGIQSVSFKNCIRLEEVVVARDATLQDFTGCISLLRLRIHKQGRSGNPDPYIGGGAFSDLSFLREIELPDVVRISAGAFEKCVSLSRITLPESLESIGDHAFMNCRSLKNIRIPAGVTYLGTDAFAEDIRLTEAEIDGSPRLGAGVFKDCVSLAKCEFEGEPESIPDSMFFHCGLLKEIRIPAGVKEIGNRAFEECRSLRSVEISDGVESIGDQAFFYTDLRTGVELPASVKHIGKKCFGRFYTDNKTKGFKLVFHGDIEDIDGLGVAWEDMIFPPDSRFVRLDDGTLIDSVEGRLICAPKDTAGVFTVPENVRTIASMAFSGCTFDRIVVPDTVTRFEDGAFSACHAKEIVLPDNMERVVDRMFERCSTPVITIPPGVKEIGERAFSACFNVKKVVLPDGLERIGKEAFRGCYIREIDIPASVKWISNDAFPYSGCNQYVQEHYGHLMTDDPSPEEADAETPPR